ncbi:MAG: NifU family protein [Bacteroidia bacterium]|nr:NifU family protein [Bacteroidia bacterium]
MNEQQDITNRVELALNTIRDYLRSDGGDVRIHQLRPDGVLEVVLLGNCESCSMSQMTLKAGIEQVVFRVAPEITRVVAVSEAIA